MTELIDAELVRLIGLIYDAVIDPDGWHDALDAIRRHFNLHNAQLTIGWLDRPAMLNSVSVNVPEQYRIDDPSYAAAIVDYWGGAERLARLPAEEPIVLSHATPPARWRQLVATNPYFVDFGNPQGLIDLVAIGLTRDHDMIAVLGMGRHESAGPVRVEEMDGLRVLAPHLRRAATISGLLDVATSKAATFEAALDATRSGVVLVDPEMGIVHANRSAEAMLKAGDPIRASRNRLEVGSELVGGTLRDAVRAAGDEAAMGRRGVALPARRRDGSPLLMNVMPLERRSRGAGIAPTAAAAVFIAETGAPPAMPRDALTLLFGLTPTEARVAELVVAGEDNARIAYALGIAESTLKTHMLRIYDKTGEHSRAGLVRFVNEIRLPG